MVENRVNVPPERRGPKLGQCQVQEPEPEDISFIVRDLARGHCLTSSCSSLFFLIEIDARPQGLKPASFMGNWRRGSNRALSKHFCPSYSIRQVLDCPPGHRLTHPLRYEEPIRRKLMRCLWIGIHDQAVVEVVAIDVNGVIGIDLD